MALKYACPSQTTWLLACRCFFQVITAGIIVLSNKPMNMSKTYNSNKKDSIPCSGGGKLRTIFFQLINNLK